VRPLALGSVVSGDDVIETAADSRVAILLTHNNVRWEIGPNRRAQVGVSVAWTLARQDKPSKLVDEETSAAGRHGEKTAATSATNTGLALDEKAETNRGAASPPAAAPVTAAPVAHQDPAPSRADQPPAEPKRKPAKTEAPVGRSADGAGATVPPPPPPPRDEPANERASATKQLRATQVGGAGKDADKANRDADDAIGLGDIGTKGGGGARGGAGGGAGAGDPLESSAATPASVDQQVRSSWARDRKALAACLDGTRATITITVTKGVARLDGSDPAITGKTRACFRAITTKWKITASAAAPFTVKLELAK
jgi:hypothetical protein